MNTKKDEDFKMTNLETSALIEAIKIIVEKSQSTKEVKKALDRIQSQLKKTK